jgi:hypothetical protein
LGDWWCFAVMAQFQSITAVVDQYTYFVAEQAVHFMKVQ